MSRPKSDSKAPRIVEGYTVGKLTVRERLLEKKNGYSYWRCMCECGGEIVLDTRCLQRKTVKDCGCTTKVKPGQKDLTGLRFGKLVCIEPTKERQMNGSTVWRCKCDCGNECLAVGKQLTVGYKKSCGCLSHPPLKDYVGKRFGKLVVTEYAGKESGMHQWKCICDCGNEAVVGQTPLQNGKTKSCGCLQATVIVDNLRLSQGTSVTVLESSKKKLLSNNTSGYTGVYQNKKSGKWQDQITFKGRTYYLGSYANIEDAIAARQRGEKMHNEFLAKYHAENDS